MSQDFYQVLMTQFLDVTNYCLLTTTAESPAASEWFPLRDRFGTMGSLSYLAAKP